MGCARKEETAHLPCHGISLQSFQGSRSGWNPAGSLRGLFRPLWLFFGALFWVFGLLIALPHFLWNDNAFLLWAVKGATPLEVVWVLEGRQILEGTAGVKLRSLQAEKALFWRGHHRDMAAARPRRAAERGQARQAGL